MLQIKTFKLTDDELASKWLEKNYNRIEFIKGELQVKVFGTVEPRITILYDKDGQGTPAWRKQALGVELANLNEQLFQYQQQLLDALYQSRAFPDSTAGKKEHLGTVERTRQMIKIHRQKIKVVEDLLANPKLADESENQESTAQPR